MLLASFRIREEKKNEAKVKRKQTTVAVLKIEREEELSNSNRQNAK